MTGEATVEQPKKISRHEFYFGIPLYRIVNISELGDDDIFNGEVDAYNFIRGFETTYKISAGSVEDYKWSPFKNVFKVTLTCKRVDSDKLIFFLNIDEGTVQKIGQRPSLATIQFAEIEKKYKDFLTLEQLQSFKKAVDLAAQGIGNGSFVYLRRIFESLILEAFKSHGETVGLEKEKFKMMWMTDKVEALKSFLPSQLVEMKGLYKILSKGVHELSEDQCLLYFPALKLSIDLILEQKIEQGLKEKRDKEVKAKIAEINESLKN